MAAKDKVSLGASLALLLASAGATANGVQGDGDSLDLDTVSGDQIAISIAEVPKVDEFILMPAEGGDFAAQHQSHASHSSHGSHASHASHFSSTTL
jgi:hypothetical protein